MDEAGCARSGRNAHDALAAGDRREGEVTTMDDGRFDALAKRLSAVPETRREALRLAACGGAGLLGALGLGDTAFARRRRRTCIRNNNECNLNRPGRCCNKQCCFDSTSGSSGTCATQGATCCSERALGGYCPREFPICCGSDRCCPPNTECCLLSGGRGTCCDPALGQVCVQGQGCQQQAPVAGASSTKGAGETAGVARGRAGN